MRTLPLLTAAALIGGIISTAQAAEPTGSRAEFAPAASGFSGAKKKMRKQPSAGYAQPQTQIACTRLGCNPIPPGCFIRSGRTWSGLPSGYDQVVCPYR